MKHSSHREQNACQNCKHSFIYDDYDEHLKYYCNIVRSRPKCGSLHLKESFEWVKNSELAEQESDNWETWAEDHQVKPSDICELHERKMEKNRP